MAALAFPWSAGEVARRGGLGAAWRGASKPGRGGSESGGACTQCVGVEMRFREGFLAAVGLAGKRNKGGELRRGMEGGRGASEERSGVREEPRRPGGAPNGGAGGQWARKTAAAAACQAPAELEVDEELEGLVLKL